MKHLLFLLPCIILLTLFNVYDVLAKEFSDVKNNDWYYASIEWATENGIVVGFPDGTFRPNSMVTEEQFLTMISRVINSKNNVYEDARARNIPIYYKLDLPLTRGEAAVYLAAYMGKAPQTNIKEGSIAFLLKQGIAKGVEGNTINGYKSEQPLTRAQAVSFIQRAINSDFSLSTGMAVTPSIEYPQEVIFSAENSDHAIEVIKNLPSVQQSTFVAVEPEINPITDKVHPLELRKPSGPQPNDAYISYIVGKNTTWHQVIISLNNKLPMEESKPIFREILRLYLDNQEVDELFEEFLNYQSKQTNEYIVFANSSSYQIKYNSYQVSIRN